MNQTPAVAARVLIPASSLTAVALKLADLSVARLSPESPPLTVSLQFIYLWCYCCCYCSRVLPWIESLLWHIGDNDSRASHQSVSFRTRRRRWTDRWLGVCSRTGESLPAPLLPLLMCCAAEPAAAASVSCWWCSAMLSSLQIVLTRRTWPSKQYSVWLLCIVYYLHDWIRKVNSVTWLPRLVSPIHRTCILWIGEWVSEWVDAFFVYTIIFIIILIIIIVE